MKTLQQFQNEISLVEAPAKAVVFMFGRFNPPTSGHEKMVKRAVQVAKRAGIRDIRLYPSFTQDARKNPLSHRDRVKLLRKFFKGVKIVDDKDARTPFAVARKLSDQGFKRVIMIAGGDRIKEFQSQISKYIKHPDPDKSFEFDEFQVVSAGERDPDAEDASGMSASKMRAFAAAKDFGNFAKGMPSRAKESDASAMFAALRKAMNLRESTFQLSTEQRDATFVQRLKDLKGPDIAEDGKCYAVVWADGRGVVAYRNRIDAVRFVEQGDRDVVSVRYRDAARNSGRSLIVRNEFKPDRSSIGEEWPEIFVEGYSSHRFWFNSKTKKLVKVTADYHDWEPVKFPEKFGLKRSQVLEFETNVTSNQDNIGGIMKLMIANKWVRCIVQNYSTPSWSIQSENLPQAAAAAKALLKKNQAPGRLFLDYGRQSAVLKDGQIEDFIKTGKIIQRTEIGATMARFR